VNTRAVQPMATCRQSPYLHKAAILIVTSFATELATLTVTDLRTNTLPHLIYIHREQKNRANLFLSVTSWKINRF